MPLETSPVRPPAGLRRRSLVLGLVAACTLAGCQNVSDTLSSIDWKDRGGVGPAALDASPLSARVVDVLAASPVTMNEQVKVSVMQGNRIRLSGFVSSSSVVQEAVVITRNIDGVSDVLDTMTVR